MDVGKLPLEVAIVRFEDGALPHLDSEKVVVVSLVGPKAYHPNFDDDYLM